MTIRLPSLWPWLCASSFFTACTSLDPALLNAAGDPIRNATPVAVVLAVAPVDASDVAWASSGSIGETELTKSFMSGLRTLDVCTDVLLIESATLDRTLPETVDLVAIPRLRTASYAYEGMAGSAVGSIALWALTWVGGLFVPDSYYDTGFVVDVALYDPRTRRQVDRLEGLRSGRTKLSFFERNHFVSLGTVEALFVPSVWTHDQEATLQESLTFRAMQHLAAATKQGLIARDLRDELDFEVRPPQGAQLSASTTDVRISAPAGNVERVIAYLNGEELEGATGVIDDEGEWVQFSGVQLRSGANFLRLRFELFTNETTHRTLRWHVRP